MDQIGMAMMTMVRIHTSASLVSARDRFLDEIGSWVRECMARYMAAPPTDVHDQATYTTGWEPYLAATDDSVALAFLDQLRETIAERFNSTGAWRHGYWTMHEVHHGTEHTELFLGMLLRLAPRDERTLARIVDVAEHLGNWSPDVAPWFDWDAGLFYSSYFGADGVKLDPGMEINTPDHFRCSNICLLAWRGSGEQRYLDLAERAAGVWARAILAADQLPVALATTGSLYALTGKAEQTYRGFAGQAPADLGGAIERAENLLASDATNTLLTLWRAGRGEYFRDAAERLLDILATQLADPDAGSVAAALRAYRRVTGDTRYDHLVRAAVGDAASYETTMLTLDLAWRAEGRPQGVGKREDMLRWLEDGEPRRANPITLALLAEIDQNQALATYAVDLARGYFQAAREALPDGRHHGCAARTVSAVARGHGRENHAGMATAVLYPVVQR